MDGVFASNLERMLLELCASSDASAQAPADMRKRFETLRNYGSIPQGKEQRTVRLSSRQVAKAILGLSAERPGWAGHTASVLGGLLPVGGPSASIAGAGSLGDAIAALMASAAERSSLVRVSLSMAEAGVNSNGWGEIVMRDGAGLRLIGFVSQLAVSLLQTGSEKGFDPTSRFNGAARVLLLPRSFFEELADRIDDAKDWPVPLGDGSEYDEDELRRARFKAIDVRPNSRFLNIGVETQATWPKEERLIQFDDYTLVLMPKTKESGPSVHIDLYANKLTDENALTVIDRFLSVAAWCSDRFAIRRDGWSGIRCLSRCLAAT